MRDPERPSRHEPQHPTTGPGRLRYDAAGERGPAIIPGLGSLLGAFDVWRLARRDERKPTGAECVARLAWANHRERVDSGAVVIDLSRGGARVFLDAPPPFGQVVTLALETPARSARVEAQVLDVRPTTTGQCVARLSFESPCPYDMFEAAVCGLAPVDPRPRPFPPPGAAGDGA